MRFKTFDQPHSHDAEWNVTIHYKAYFQYIVATK